MLEIKNLTFSYSKKEGKVLDGLSLSLEEGKIGVILGPNGAGKSTLLKCVDGLLKPSSGAIILGETPLKNMSKKQKSQQIAIVFQENELGALDVYDSVRLGRLPYSYTKESAFDDEKTLKALEMVSLTDKMSKNVRDLSGGERQKVALARALAQEAKLLLLDEPTSSLDIKNQEILLSLVKELKQKEGLTVLLSLHDINLALRFGDSFFLFKNGKIANSGPSDVINEKTIECVYGIKTKEHLLDGHKYLTLGEGEKNEKD